MTNFSSNKYICIMFGLALSGYIFMVDWPKHWMWVLAIVAIVTFMFVLWVINSKKGTA